MNGSICVLILVFLLAVEASNNPRLVAHWEHDPTNNQRMIFEASEDVAANQNREALSCIGKAAGLHPNPNDCSRFFECRPRIVTTLISQSCSPGFKFNPITKTCGLASDTKC